MTNFHLPKSTLLVLVSALAGRELILEAYAKAVEAEYRFYQLRRRDVDRVSQRRARHSGGGTGTDGIPGYIRIDISAKLNGFAHRSFSVVPVPVVAAWQVGTILR